MHDHDASMVPYFMSPLWIMKSMASVVPKNAMPSMAIPMRIPCRMTSTRESQLVKNAEIHTAAIA